MVDQQNEIKICPWRGDRRWVYSITFDEALSDLHRYTIPILKRYGVPGHLEVVVGQMGQVRRLFQSSYNGYKHMSAEELRNMLDSGWGVGCHGWSHTFINTANMDRELGDAKHVLENALGQPVTIFAAPGDNTNMSDEVLEGCRRYGFLSAMSIFEALNRPDDPDLMWLNRVFLHDKGPNQHDSEFDPYRKIQHAQRDQGWIIDYLHCPLEQPIHPRKDCSAAQLQERIETIVSIGGDEVWLARVEEPVDYRYTRRCLQITRRADEVFELHTIGLPSPVANRVVTLELPANTSHCLLNSREQSIYRRNGKALVDVDGSQPGVLQIVPAAN